MKLLNWVRFTWNLTELSPLNSPLPAHYKIAPATSEDEKKLRKVFSSSLLLDPTWNPVIGEVMENIQAQLDHVFASADTPCLALRHGTRIIGASVVSLQFDAENHLWPGPCISMEYRNRGFGTRLLERSLMLLRESGMAHATGIAPRHAPVTKFLYPKFNGVPAPAEFAGLIAA